MVMDEEGKGSEIPSIIGDGMRGIISFLLQVLEKGTDRFFHPFTIHPENAFDKMV